MDDGGFANPGVRIATHSFPLKDVEYIVTILKSLYDLDCTVENIYFKDRYNVYIKANSINKLKKIVMPYIHPSMYYKLGND